MKLSELKASFTEQKQSEFVGGIYPRQQLTIIASAPGLGKTWLILKQALDITMNSPFFGTDIVADRPGRATIFCGETGESLMMERLSMLGVTQETYPEGLSLYTYSAFVSAGTSICLDEEEGRKNFAEIVKGEHPDVVFIDTLISFRSDDENAAKETGAMLNFVRLVAEKNNCAIVLMHHVRKRKLRDKFLEANQDEIIGTSAFTRLCAVAFVLQEQAFSSSVKVSCVKSWYAKPTDFYFNIVPIGEHIMLRETYESIDPNHPETKLGAVLEWIRALPRWGEVSTKTLVRECKCSRQTASRAIKEALSQDLIIMHFKDGNTCYYHRNEHRGSMDEH